MKVNGKVDDSIGTQTENRKEFEAAVIDTMPDEVTAGGSEGGAGHIDGIRMWGSEEAGVE